jgi:hypothetical protein
LPSLKAGFVVAFLASYVVEKCDKMSSAADWARLRRERKKEILGQGNSHLKKIVGLQCSTMGHEAIGRDKSERATDAHPDPPEADLSNIGKSTNSVHIEESKGA